MHFSMREFCKTNPLGDPPYAVVDAGSEALIWDVTEFDDVEGWLRVICRDGEGNMLVDQVKDEIVTQIVHVPFKVIDRPSDAVLKAMPRIYVDTVQAISR